MHSQGRAAAKAFTDQSRKYLSFLILSTCQLKEVLDAEKYKTMARRLIEFDEDMASSKQTWIDVWTELHNYHTKDEDIERRQRILSLHTLLMDIQESSGDLAATVLPVKQETIDNALAGLGDRDVAWALVLEFVHDMRDARRNDRLTAAIKKTQCAKCFFALATHYL